MSLEGLVRPAKDNIVRFPHPQRLCQFPEHAYYEHHRSITDLAESALRGCGFCGLVLDRFQSITYSRHCFPDWPDEAVDDSDETRSMYDVALGLPSSDVKIAISYRVNYPNASEVPDNELDCMMVQVGPFTVWSETHDTWSEFYDGSSGKDKIPRLTLDIKSKDFFTASQLPVMDGMCIGRFTVDGDLGSSANHAIAKYWLNDCQSNHPECASTAPRLPTRVIDVGTHERSECPRLTLSRGRRANYAALSHCWGGHIPTMLTCGTLEEFQDALPLHSLPANFRDAITITRGLGIAYLWVDSLCIIQDSRSDWETESKAMCEVYRKSTVTICATASKTAMDGILKKSAVNPKYALVNLRSGDVKGDTMKVELRYLEDDAYELERRGPLGERGWTMQEFILAPRKLYYGRQQLYWKCPHKYQSADGKEYGPMTSTSGYATIEGSIHFGDIERATESLDPTRLLREYYNLIRVYSARRLTFESDKLPAISGISQLLHRRVGGDYLAGLWSSDFNQGILWHKTSPRDGDLPFRNVSEYRAPSWSWAATDDAVSFRLSERSPREPTEMDLRLIRSDITPRLASNVFGEIKSGYVVVDAMTIPLKRSSQILAGDGIAKDSIGKCQYDEPPSTSGPESDVEAELFCAKIDSGRPIIISAYLGASFIQDPTGVSQLIPDTIWETGDVGVFPSEDCVAVLSYVEVESDYAIKSILEGWEKTGERLAGHGLVLKQVRGRTSVAYERVGIFHILNQRMDWYHSWTREQLLLV